jgi:hypothetical protein
MWLTSSPWLGGAESPVCTGRRPRARTQMSRITRLRVCQRAEALPAERDRPASAAPVAPIGASRGAGAPLSAPAARRAGGLGLGRRRGEHLGHVGVDQLLTGRRGYRYPMVTVADEMPMAHAVDLQTLQPARLALKITAPHPPAASARRPGSQRAERPSPRVPAGQRQRATRRSERPFAGALGVYARRSLQLRSQASIRGGTADDPGCAVPVQPPPVRGDEQRSSAAFAGGQVDGAGSARRERDGDDLAALAGNGRGTGISSVIQSGNW